MFEKFSTSYRLVLLAFSYIKQEGELLAYAMLSLCSTLLVLASFASFHFFYLDDMAGLSPELQNILQYVLMFLFYLVCSFVTCFFNTAIITTVKRKLEGQENAF
jgi:hypothetical protein